MRLSGSKKSGGQRVISSRAYASISTFAKRRKSLPMPRRTRVVSLGGVREIQGDSCAKKRCANVSRKRSRGWVNICYRQAVVANGDLSSKKTSSHPYLRGKRKQAALSSCTAKVCCKFCSARQARATRKTEEEARRDVRDPCRRGRPRPTRPLEKARLRRLCGQRPAWAWVRDARSQCLARGGGLWRPMWRHRCPDSCRVPRAGPAQALATTTHHHRAGSRCPYLCAPPLPQLLLMAACPSCT